jgi:hypothetical protein
VAKNRDEFLDPTKETLSKRVNGVCSNPGCRQSTRGPHATADKAVSIGVAAHIRAAASGGPRADSSISALERRSIENGIWLCQNCATLIDRDEAQFEIATLEAWKRDSEAEASFLLANPVARTNGGASSFVSKTRIAVDLLGDPIAPFDSRKCAIESTLRLIEGQATVIDIYFDDVESNTDLWRAHPLQRDVLRIAEEAKSYRRRAGRVSRAATFFFTEGARWMSYLPTEDLVASAFSAILGLLRDPLSSGPGRSGFTTFDVWHCRFRELATKVVMSDSDLADVQAALLKVSKEIPFPFAGPAFWDCGQLPRSIVATRVIPALALELSAQMSALPPDTIAKSLDPATWWIGEA